MGSDLIGLTGRKELSIGGVEGATLHCALELLLDHLAHPTESSRQNEDI